MGEVEAECSSPIPEPVLSRIVRLCLDVVVPSESVLSAKGMDGVLASH